MIQTYSDQCKALSPKTVFLKSFILEKTKEIKQKHLRKSPHSMYNTENGSTEQNHLKLAQIHYDYVCAERIQSCCF